MTTSTRVVRRGLPRYPGGEAWPPVVALNQEHVAVSTPDPVNNSRPVHHEIAPHPATAKATEPETDTLGLSTSGAESGFTRQGSRQGLPRIAGGNPWPPVTKPVEVPVVSKPVVSKPVTTPPATATTPTPPVTPQQPTSASSVVVTPETAQPQIPRSQPHSASTSAKPKTLGPLMVKQWIPVLILGAFAVFGMATALVLGARWLLSLDTVAQFVTTYPGEYALPESAPVGFPAWLGWQHFFNIFLMVLIIRTGLQVRHQQKPPAYWSSKRSPKVSINVWLHQSLDVLWLINGLVFVVLLIATGHWMRIVPTSWEVFPNAISAALQYMSLDWPTENGWVHYNALQELAYFATVFIAAPLAAVTGFRMSAFWPKNVDKLNRVYPVEVARKLHFPIMIYFVVFIFTHVALVFSTGALRNLNHMYAAQGSTDPVQYAANWTGFWMFAASLLVIGLAWIACRPILVAPIARLFGTVSKR